MAVILEEQPANRSASSPPTHTSVMVAEALACLITDPTGIYIDGTAGLGGHAGEIARRLSGAGRLIAVDRDELALQQARESLQAVSARVTFCRDNFKNLPLVLNRLGITACNGLLLDLGVSSFQLLQADRGFSFQLDGPLDMRMDSSQRQTAAELVNNLSADELTVLIRRFGEERRAGAVARAIVETRKTKRFTTTLELARLLEKVVRRRGVTDIHPATRTFMALRIAVNKELEGLGDFLVRMADYLTPGGRLVVISFHSLEDRIVKNAFQLLEGRCICRRPRELCQCPRRPVVRVLTRKPMTPDFRETQHNPRSRSAKLRAVEKLPGEAISTEALLLPGLRPDRNG